MISGDHLWLLAIALLLDALVGDPRWLWARIPHPVVLFGALVATFDRRLNRETDPPATRRMRGVVAIAGISLIAAGIAAGIEAIAVAIPFGWVLTLILAVVMIAGRSLYDHVAAVMHAFPSLPAARRAVSEIVGRDPETLDESGVCRAAIESAAENFSDGVVAPALWFALLGLPGLFAYKAINTADSMIGHRTPRHGDFGWAAARLDDLVNIPASRLAGALLALAAPLAGGQVVPAFKTMLNDAGRHRSPNAGWPEAAMASALGISLAGPRTYRGIVVRDPYMNETGRKAVVPADIARALRVYVGAGILLLALTVLSALLFAPL